MLDPDALPPWFHEHFRLSDFHGTVHCNHDGFVAEHVAHRLLLVVAMKHLTAAHQDIADAVIADSDETKTPQVRHTKTAVVDYSEPIVETLRRMPTWDSAEALRLLLDTSPAQWLNRLQQAKWHLERDIDNLTSDDPEEQQRG